MGNRGCACTHTDIQDEVEQSKKILKTVNDLEPRIIERPKKNRSLTQ